MEKIKIYSDKVIMHIKSKPRLYLVLIVGVLLGISVCLLINKPKGPAPVNYGPFGGFAQCLTDKNVKVFGTSWCATCKDQEGLFGRSWDLINSIECSDGNSRARNAVCMTEKIEAYPTWEFSDGSRQVVDNLTFEFLSEKSGCPLPSNMINSNL